MVIFLMMTNFWIRRLISHLELRWVGRGGDYLNNLLSIIFKIFVNLLSCLLQGYSDLNYTLSLPDGLPRGLLLKIGRKESLWDLSKNLLGFANFYGISGLVLLRQHEGLHYVQWQGGNTQVQHQQLPWRCLLWWKFYYPSFSPSIQNLTYILR